jgi:hypothetical protein
VVERPAGDQIVLGVDLEKTEIRSRGEDVVEMLGLDTDTHPWLNRHD